MAGYSSAEILRTSDVETLEGDLALKDVDVRELIHLFWGGLQSSLRREKSIHFVLGRAAFASPRSNQEKLACRVEAPVFVRHLPDYAVAGAAIFDLLLDWPAESKLADDTVERSLPVRLRQGYGATVFA